MDDMESGIRLARRLPFQKGMENKRCLVIADDLTGEADTGVQFLIRGLNTCLISPDSARPIDFSRYLNRDVLVVNTHSRSLNARQASERITLLLKDYRRDLFPLVYKKIDSTLRGNMGSEIDALLEKKGFSVGFVAPSFPEQKRSLVGGIMMVDGKPLSLTEAAQDAVSPIHESHVHKLLEAQSRWEIARIDLTYVASTAEKLHAEVMRECRSGNYGKSPSASGNIRDMPPFNGCRSGNDGRCRPVLETASGHSFGVHPRGRSLSVRRHGCTGHEEYRCREDTA